MKPHSLGTISLVAPQSQMSRAEKLKAAGWAGRHGLYWPKGTKLPETQVPACPKVKVSDLPEKHLKQNHIERLEHDQTLASCCRHPENHEVEARKTHPDEQAPDIYIFHCTCGKQHRFMCAGATDVRPVWEAS